MIIKKILYRRRFGCRCPFCHRMNYPFTDKNAMPNSVICGHLIDFKIIGRKNKYFFELNNR